MILITAASGSWNDDGICADFVIVLLEDRTPRAQVRVREHPEENLVVIAGIGDLREFEPLHLVEVRWSDDLPLVGRSVCEVFGGDGPAVSPPLFTRRSPWPATRPILAPTSP